MQLKVNQCKCYDSEIQLGAAYTWHSVNHVSLEFAVVCRHCGRSSHSLPTIEEAVEDWNRYNARKNI